MKKQVKFVETSCNDRRAHQIPVINTPLLPRSAGLNHSQRASTCVIRNLDYGLKMRRRAAPLQAQQTHPETIQIPKTMTAAPFLKHTELTPGQKRYLYSIAEAYSTEHMRRLIQQHYLNVLHRCIRTGHNPFRDEDSNVNPQLMPEPSDLEHDRQLGSRTHSRTKHSRQQRSTTVHSGKNVLPKINNHRKRTVLGSSGSGERQSRKQRTNNTPVKRSTLNESKSSYDLERERPEEDSIISEYKSFLSTEDEDFPPDI